MPRNIDKWITKLASSNNLERTDAALALSRTKSAKAIPFLTRVLGQCMYGDLEHEYDTATEALIAIGRHHRKAATREMIRAIEENLKPKKGWDEKIRATQALFGAIRVLGSVGTKDAGPLILRLTRDFRYRGEAMRAMSTNRDLIWEQAHSVLLKAVVVGIPDAPRRDLSEEVADLAAKALALVADPAFVQPLQRSAKRSARADLRKRIVSVLRAIDHPSSVEALRIMLLKEKRGDIRKAIGLALTKAGRAR